MPPISTAGLSSRKAALQILAQVRSGKTFEVALDRSIGSLSEADRRLAHEMAAGVLRQRSALDSRIAPLLPRGWASVTPELQDILRLGAYQLSELDRVPDHAAVNTSVNLAREAGGTRAAAFVNAVLRRVAGAEPASPLVAVDPVERLAIEHSHPVWLVRRWVGNFGLTGTENLLRWNNSRPALVLQAARKELDELAARWRESGIAVERAPYGAGLLTSLTRPADVPGFHEGAFMVQDPAQALLARFAGVPPTALVYDACAAPGGKTIALGRRARAVIAGDASPARAKRLAENLRRAGSGRESVVVADARHPPLRQADVVVVDAPCLGTGTFARHPDARWRVTPQALASLERLQREILEEAATLVQPGGLLVYSTCSLEPEENQLQVEAFLRRHAEFSLERGEGLPQDLLSDEGNLMILPQIHGIDGAFGARFRRQQ
ncbi:MAG TPA: 16S rRNA (cytosine(967)-C(5))-methyltransferase RsmB [Gemmatimonadales bacterium]|nr:16S rRNA (cytosine(967)-C(5))-methyltransferase RsmB [Gemmatimonadales bacterium]